MSRDRLCPDPDRVAQLMAGSLPDEEIDTICDHVTACPKCTTILRSLSDNLDLFQALSSDQSNWFSDPGDRQSVANLIEQWRDVPVQVGASESLDSSNADFRLHTASADIKPNVDELAERLLRRSSGGDELGWLGPYRILSILGVGGMGVVFEGEDPSLHRRVAIKAMQPCLIDRAEYKKRFLREARAAASIDHDHIVPIHHVGEDRDVPYFVMPLLNGESLEHKLRSEGPLSIKQAIEIGTQIARGIAAAHVRGLIHRDIKPANIFLEDRGQQVPRVRLLDFGLSYNEEDDSQLTKTGAIAGTPTFMSPEQARGEQTDARGDLFSLGCVLYYALAGKPPFTGRNSAAVMYAIIHREPESLLAINFDVPVGLSNLVDQLLRKNASERIQRAEDVVDALSKIAAQPFAIYAGDAQATLPALETSTDIDKGSWNTSNFKLVGGVLAIAGLFALAGLLWTMKVETPHGIIVLNADPGAISGASVYVDEQQKITLATSGENAPITLEVDPGKHKLRVSKPGFELFTNEFSVLGNDRKEIQVRLEPKQSGQTSSAVATQVSSASTNSAKLFGDEPFPGLIPKPTSVAGLRRWQIETQGLRGDIFAVAWNHDSDRVVVGSPTGIVRIIDVNTSKTLSVFPAHRGSVWAVDWSPTTDNIVTAGEDGAVRLVDTGGQLQRELGKHAGIARCVAFSRDGSWIASGGFDCQVRLWRTSGEPGPVLKGHTSQIDGIAWHPSGKRIASASLDGTIRIWDLNGTWQTSNITGQQLNGHLGGVLGLAWSFDGRLLASAGVDGSVIIWNSDGSKQSVLSGHGNAVTAIDWSSEGLLATSGDDKSVRLWRHDGTPLAVQALDTTRINDLVWSRDGKRLAVATGDHGIRILNPEGSWSGAIELDSLAIRAIAIDKTGEIASVGDDGFVALWNADGTQKAKLTGQNGRIRSVAWNPDGTKLITASHEDAVRIWDASNGTSTTANGTAPAAWHPTGSEVAWASGAEVHVEGAGLTDRVLSGHPAQVVQLAWNAAGSLLASADASGEIRVWDHDGTPHGVIKAEPPVAALAWQPNKPLLTTSSLANGKICLWSLDGNLVRTWNAHSKAVIALAWNSAGDRLLSSSFDQSVRVWSEDGTSVAQLAGPMAICTAVAWHEPSHRIVTAAIDGVISLWDSRSYESVSNSLVFPDGAWIRFDSKGIASTSNPGVIDSRLSVIAQEQSGHMRSMKPSEFQARYNSTSSQ